MDNFETASSVMTRPEMTDKIVALCTCPDAETGARLARLVVEKRCAACVNLLPAVRSFYQWEGEVADEAETLMLIKTTRARYAELERVIIAEHPYELPELIAVPIERGFERYLVWVEDGTS